MDHLQFWEEHPALLLGLSFLGGIGAALFGLPLWISALWLLYVGIYKRWSSIGAWILAFCYAWTLYGSLPSLDQPISCKARFSIASIQSHQSPFHRSLLYRGTLFLQGHSLPCSLSVKDGKQRPIASGDYWIEGIVEQRAAFDYVLKPTSWSPISNSWSLAELRYRTKEQLKTFLSNKCTTPRVATFLYSLFSGEVEDRLLRYEFGRLGLQHILAISGFHFGILMACFSAGLGWFLPKRWKWILMLGCATLYFVFIGSSPAVERAWIGASLFLVSKLLRKPPNPINLLGSVLLIELILHPLVVSHLGFQLSFASCFGILFFHKWVEGKLCLLLPKRTVSVSSQLSFFSQWIYLASSWFRKSLSITLSVNLVLLPLLLYHLGRFPWLSLLYNLFYPFLVGLALLGLVFGLIAFFLIGPLSAPLFSFLNWWTAQLLAIVAYPPLVLDRCLYMKELPAEGVMLYLIGSLLGGIWVRDNDEKNDGIRVL